MPHSEIAIDLSVWAGRLLLRPLQALIATPSLLFLAALTAMLLRPPDVAFYEIDRVVFGLLVVGVVGRGIVLGQKVFIVDRVAWPMIGLLCLALASMIGQPFNNETWSLLASKLIIPMGLFYLAGLVFTDERRFRQFEVFALVVLAYLSFTSIAFLCGARFLIFPKFILDESLGFHASRARGPLLQAVANGVSLNLLGLLALHAYRRGSVRGAKMIVLLGSVPFAILATMTRTVWLSFAGSAGAVLFLSKHSRLKSRELLHAVIGLVLIAGVGTAVVLSSQGLSDAVSDRVGERGPVDYRAAVLAGGWEMFLEHPLIGWGFHRMPAELPRYVSGYNEKVLYPHNTYLELLVEHGIVGLTLYLWLMWEMWRLGRGAIPTREARGFLDRDFHRMWPVLLFVYWANAATVVMSYQFVNGLLFTLAGMLAAQRRRAESC
jgi:O-antigen ligase